MGYIPVYNVDMMFGSLPENGIDRKMVLLLANMIINHQLYIYKFVAAYSQTEPNKTQIMWQTQ